jgi:hypothetical protein
LDWNLRFDQHKIIIGNLKIGETKMENEKQRYAFISYSTINKEFTTNLVKGLKSGGYPVWFDLLDMPADSRRDDEVGKALRECSIFMIILAPESMASENVKDEIGYAIDHGKHILPVLLEACDVPLRLRHFQHVDFTTQSFDEGLESTKELLGRLVEEAPANFTASDAQIAQKAEAEHKASQAAEVLAIHEAATYRMAKAEAEKIAKQKMENQRLAKVQA